jgi:ferritin-like metal-binding protein YciE
MAEKNGDTVNKNNGDSATKGTTATQAFKRNITTIYGLNLALSYENAAADRLEQRLSQCKVPEIKKNLERHLRQTNEQQKRLRQRIYVLAANTVDYTDVDGGKNGPAMLSSSNLLKATDEKGHLPVPEPPVSIKMIMDAVGTESEREVWESVNDLIVERAEVVMYRAGIDALQLLEADKKTINALKKNLKEEETFAKLLEKNNPRIAKKLMAEQMRKDKKEKRGLQKEQSTQEQKQEEATAIS